MGFEKVIRLGFVITVVCAALGDAAAAATYELFPTGRPVNDPASDSRLLHAVLHGGAVDGVSYPGACDGDVIRLRSVDAAGAARPWLLGDTIFAKMPIYTNPQRFEINSETWSAAVAGHKQKIVTDKAVTFEGDVGADGKAATRITLARS